MRKFVMVSFVVFTASVFALSGMAQRRRGRGRARGRATAAAAVQAEPPTSARISQELAGIPWGATHDQVVAFFRTQITARYVPLLRNQGQVEQDRLMQQRDREIQQVRDSYIQFNGRVNQRRWDTSFLAGEYTHNNGESMLMREDPTNGNREFFFFFNDRLWKRYQARAIPQGARIEFAVFAAGLEQLFGNGRRRVREGTDQLETVEWQDATTHLRLVNNATFYNSFGLVFEERATLGRLAELRRNAPPPTTSKTASRLPSDEPIVGNVDNDPNPDIVDRITGKMRRLQNAPANANAQGSGSASVNGGGRPAPNSNSNSNSNNNNDDGLGGL